MMIKDMYENNYRIEYNEETYVSMLWSYLRNRYLKGNITKEGYTKFYIIVGDKKYCKGLHKILGEAFIPNPKNLPTVDHINNKRYDNRLDNLRWATHRTQSLNRINPTSLGKDNPASKKIYQRDLQGNLINTFYGFCEAERATGIKRSHMRRCCLGKCETARGYIFEFTDKQVKKVIHQFDKVGNFIQIFNTVKEITTLYNIHYSVVYQCLNGNYKTAGGYIYKYVEIEEEIK